MQRITVVVLLLLAIMVSPAAGGDDVYIVKPGDTLSGIALKIYGDTSKWPQLLEANPQVTDPELIYPGDSLVTTAGESYSVSSGGTVEPIADYQPLPVGAPSESAAAAVPVPSNLPVQIVKPPLSVSGPVYRSAGYITKELPQGAVVGSFSRKISLVEGDEIIVDQPAAEGARLTVLRPMQQVHHPASGDYLGWVVRVVGWADVTCGGESTSRARLAVTLDTVNVGDLVAPFDPNDVLENNIIDTRPSTVCLTEQGAGYILAAQDSNLKVTIGAGDIVFLDRGRDAGVETGDQFSAYRRTGSDWPEELAILQVLRVGERTSTAMVVKSIKEITVHDLVQPRSVSEDASGG